MRNAARQLKSTRLDCYPGLRILTPHLVLVGNFEGVSIAETFVISSWRYKLGYDTSKRSLEPIACSNLQQGLIASVVDGWAPSSWITVTCTCLIGHPLKRRQGAILCLVERAAGHGWVMHAFFDGGISPLVLCNRPSCCNTQLFQ